MRPRVIDHDKARALHAQGLSYGKIAKHLGCSKNAVYLACNDAARAAMNKRNREWAKANPQIHATNQKMYLAHKAGEIGVATQ